MTMMMMLITMMIMIMMMTLLMTMMTIGGEKRGEQENVNKAIGLMSKTTTQHVHHAFLYISLLSLVNYDVR